MPINEAISINLDEKKCGDDNDDDDNDNQISINCCKKNSNNNNTTRDVNFIQMKCTVCYIRFEANFKH